MDSLEIGDDPHLREWEMILEVEHYQWGKIKVLGSPFKILNGQSVVKTSPQLGEHNHDIFSGLLSLTEADIKRLKDLNII